jgi:hypothetical protein
MENFEVDRIKVSRIWGACDFKEIKNQNANEFYTDIVKNFSSANPAPERKKRTFTSLREGMIKSV